MTSARDDSDAAEQAAREATAWFVRLNNPLATDEDRRGFNAWVSADPAHAAAIAETEDLWDQLRGPAARLRASGERRAGAARPRGRAWRMAAAAALLATAGAALWRDAGVIDRAFADHATRPGERRDVRLDGAEVYLDGDSAIATSRLETLREVTILRGRVWFDVTPDAVRPFRVHAAGIDARALSAAFGVDRDAASVTVGRGEVAASAAGGAPVRVAAGERARLSDSGVGAPARVEPAVALAWRRGLIVLDAAPLGDVVGELARMAPGRVVIPDPAVRALTLSGVFRADDPDAVVEAIRVTLGLRSLSVPGLATVIYR